MTQALLFYLLGVNVLAFVIYGIDKYKAQKNLWRIPEKTLLLMAFIGGAIGAYSGMQVFRHKTQHASFKIIVPLCVIGWALLIIYLLNN